MFGWSEVLGIVAVAVLLWGIEMWWFLRRVDAMRRADPDLLRFGGQLTALNERVAALEKRASAAESTAQRDAVALARGGADAATIARECSVSLGEAELIVSLQAPNKKPH